MSLKSGVIGLFNNEIVKYKSDLDELAKLSLSGCRIKLHDKENEMRVEMSNYINMREQVYTMSDEEVREFAKTL